MLRLGWKSWGRRPGTDGVGIPTSPRGTPPRASGSGRSRPVLDAGIMGVSLMSMWRAVRTLPRPRLLALSVTAIASTAATLVSADLRQDYRPAAYAIRGATIVAGPATTVTDGTVVVRDGVIEAVGPSAKVAVPFDAEVIEG